MTPNNLKYSKEHEWVKMADNGNVIVGITDFAQKALGSLVFVNLPEVGDELTAGESFGDVESVKAVSPVYSPLSGVVCAINEELLDNPELINNSPYDAWFIEVEKIEGLDMLMTAAEYDEFCKNNA